MPGVATVIAGSRYVADWALANGAEQATVVWTGTRSLPSEPPGQEVRGLTVAWAQTRPMDYSNEAAFVARVMVRVAEAMPGVTLRLYDRREGDAADFAHGFAAPGLRVEWRPSMSYGDYLKSFEDVALGLAPLLPDAPFVRGKSFGKVLGYLERGVPVVCSDAGEHPAFFDPDTALMSNDEDVLVAGMIRLLAEPGARAEMARHARARFLDCLTSHAAAERVAKTLGALVQAMPLADWREMSGMVPRRGLEPPRPYGH
ncbi:glycosyltransferase [Alphaproteobacteria bacterium GH1-50]|uniref:Glycosyltransferase n=2 Tax=Kangsaoukella pontilimi TaxID=2691042 RepID=A0A7C9N0Z6_9RHOB|nr:glycosyltransferase [Kangsaoukella pontilimi]